MVAYVYLRATGENESVRLLITELPKASRESSGVEGDRPLRSRALRRRTQLGMNRRTKGDENHARGITETSPD